MCSLSFLQNFCCAAIAASPVWTPAHSRWPLSFRWTAQRQLILPVSLGSRSFSCTFNTVLQW